MKQLLDTHVLISVLQNTPDMYGKAMEARLRDHRSDLVASVASVWEVAIKFRLGKLRLLFSIDDIGDLIGRAGLKLIDIDVHHVLANLNPWPPTRDPFDRLLLAQCQVDRMRLLTVDRALIDHPLAAR